MNFTRLTLQDLLETEKFSDNFPLKAVVSSLESPVSWRTNSVDSGR